MITPLGVNVLGKLVEAEKVTKSGIYLGDSAAAQLAPKMAEIIAVGDDVTKVSKGDRVVFKPYATYDITENKIDYIMLEEADILGISK